MQKIFLVLSFLCFSLSFCMEELPDLKTMQSYIDNAQKASNLEEKLKWYGMAANIRYPQEGYAQERKLRREATAFLYTEMKKLTDKAEYKEALRISSYAPQIFTDQIEALQKLIPFQDQIQQAIQLKKFEDIYKIFDRAELKDISEIEYWKVHIKEQEKDYYYNEAQEAQKRGDKQKEQEWLGKIVNMDLPYAREYRDLRSFSQKIFDDMKNEASKLESEGKYEEALEIYNFAPRMFHYEIKHMEVLKKFKKAMQDKNFQEALRILNSPDLFFRQELQNLKSSIEIQYYLQKARELGENKEAWKWYAQAAKVSLPSAPSSSTDPYKDVRLLQKEAINKISEVVTNLKNQGAYDEIQKFYNSAPQIFANEIEALQKYLPFKKEIQKAILLKNQKNFEGALAILDDAGLKNLPDIVKLKMNIQNEKRKLEQQAKALEQEQPTQVAPKIEKKWLFIKNMPGTQVQEDPDADWRIKGQELQLDINATEAMTLDSFANLIKKAEDGLLPFILVMAESEDIPDPKKPTEKPKKYTHFFDGTVINRFMSSLKKTEEKLGSSRAYIQDPLNRQKVINIEIYVMGNDGKLHLLQDKTDINYLNQFVKEKPDTQELVGGTYVWFYNYDLQPVLTTPGSAQIFIANLFKQKAEKNLASKEGQIALQYAQQWYDWAMKQALQSLTRSLRHVAAKLHRF